MLLGKRPRPPMKRTTSLTEISFDLGAVEAPHQRPVTAADGVAGMADAYARCHQQQAQKQQQYQHILGEPDGLDNRYLSSLVSPRNSRRNSGDFAVETAHFLRACGLCKRRLGPGRDTFMYRGEVAFCSLECRQQQMNQDERKEKCSLRSMKNEPAQAAAAEAAVDGETVAAA